MKHILYALLLTVTLPACAIAQSAGADVAVGNSGEDMAAPTPSPAVPVCGYPPEWVGKKVDRALIETMNREVRILHPNDPVTRDYDPIRLNVIIDDHDIVTEVRCG